VRNGQPQPLDLGQEAPRALVEFRKSVVLGILSAFGVGTVQARIRGAQFAWKMVDVLIAHKRPCDPKRP
jgi:hypothetical protein